MSREKETVKLTLILRLAFGMGNMLNVLGAVGMWFPYATAFFTKVLQLETHQAETIVLVAHVAGGIFAPLLGILSDACSCRIYGRRKTLHLLGVLAFACSFFFIWHHCFGCHEKYRTLYYAAIAVVFQFGYAAMQISQLALVPELAPNKQNKVELNSIRFGFQVGGTLFTLILLWILLDKLPCDYSLEMNSTFPNTSCGSIAKLDKYDSRAFWISAIIVIILGILMAIPFHIVIREKFTVLKKQRWYKWLLMPNFYLIICTYVAAKIITVFTQQFLPFYFLDTLKMNQTSISVGPLVLYIASFVATLSVKKVNTFIGEKMLYFIGVAFVWGAIMWFWVQPSSTATTNFDLKRDSIYISLVLLGIGGAVLMVLSLSMISFLIGDFSGSSAFVYGWVQFVDRVSNGLLNKLVLSLKDSPDNAPGASPEEDAFNRHVIVFTPFAATALGLIAVCLMSAIDTFQRKKLQVILETKDNGIQTDNTGPDQSADDDDTVCVKTCCCNSSAEKQMTANEQKLLISSYREQLLQHSARNEPINYKELELTLTT